MPTPEDFKTARDLAEKQLRSGSLIEGSPAHTLMSVLLYFLAKDEEEALKDLRKRRKAFFEETLPKLVSPNCSVETALDKAYRIWYAIYPEAEKLEIEASRRAYKKE